MHILFNLFYLLLSEDYLLFYFFVFLKKCAKKANKQLIVY